VDHRGVVVAAFGFDGCVALSCYGHFMCRRRLVCVLGATLALGCGPQGAGAAHLPGAASMPVATVRVDDANDAAAGAPAPDRDAHTTHSPSGLAPGALTPVVDRGWRAVSKQHGLPNPLAAIVQADLVVNEPLAHCRMSWLVSRDSVGLVGLTYHPIKQVPYGTPPQPQVESIVTMSTQVLADSAAGELHADLAELSATDELVTDWPTLARRLTAEPTLQDVPKTARSVEHIIRVEVSFLVAHPNGDVSRVLVRPGDPGTFRERLDVDEPQRLRLKDDRWSLQASLPETSVTPWLHWTTDIIEAGRKGEPLPTGYLPFAKIDPVKPLYRPKEIPNEAALASFAWLDVAYVPDDIDPRGMGGFAFELMVVQGAVKIARAEPTGRKPSAVLTTPAARGFFDPVIERLRDGDLKALLVTPEDVAVVEAFAQRPMYTSSRRRFATLAELTEIRKQLRAASAKAAAASSSLPPHGYVLRETKLLARTRRGDVFLFETDVDEREHLEVDTDPLFRIRRVEPQ
jgi:hypothetical protein